LHMRFRLAPRSMTLNDLELLKIRIFGKFRGILQIWEATTAKGKEWNRLYYQRQRCNPLKVLLNIMFLALICMQ